MKATQIATPGSAGLRITEAEFKRTAELIKSLAGIHLTDGKRELVGARLAKRIRALELASLNDYLDVVKNDKSGDELVMMLDALTTNLTSFWRESDHFDYVVQHVLPKLEAAQQREIRVWSAGCSTGEEPYGLAMLMLGNLRNPQTVKPRVLATDLSTRVLDVAKRGRYGAERVKNIPSDLLRKFMKEERTTTGTFYQVQDSIRSLVTFGRLNLMEDWPMKGPFDFIFCRNVMIYFDKPTQATLVERFGKLLKSGGTLFVGHSESLAGVQRNFKYVRPTIYEKP